MKYIAYCRKSTDEPDKQILSIEGQLDELKEFAKREKLQVIDYITESKTAKKPGRTKFAEVLKLIETEKANGILSWHPDRLARNSIDGGQIIYLLDAGKLKDLKFPTFWFDNTPQGKFMLNMAFSQAKYYVDNLSVNVKRGNRQKLRLGNWPNKAPFGYLNNKANKTIYIDKLRAKFVVKAFQLFSTGKYSYMDIKRFFNQNQIKNKSGTELHLDKVKRILTAPFYYGMMKFNGELFKGSHKPLIKKKLFDQCQKVVKQRSRCTQFQKTNFDFLGLIKCKECGSSITAEKHTKHYQRTNRTASYTYYRCSKKRRICFQPYIRKKEIEEQIRRLIKKVSLPKKAYQKFLYWLEKDKQKAKLHSQAKINGLTRQLKSTETKLDRLLEAYLDKLIDSQGYQLKKNELIEKQADLKENLKTIHTTGNTWLEPFSDWIDQAFHACKIARAKNNGHELAFMAKTVSSNLFLNHRQLLADYALPGWQALTSTSTDAKKFKTVSNLLPD